MLDSIERYYKKRCDGLWEHHFGFTIESCDNPGWVINIKDPHLFSVVSSLIKENRIPACIDVSLRDPELSELVLFSQHLHSLSDFMKDLLNVALVRE